MLFLIFVYYLARSIDASAILPIPPIDSPNSCTDLTHCRTIWNILWACLITIFSSTWVVVHPNIPRPRKREAGNRIRRWIWNPLLSSAGHRLPLFVCALLIPEYMLASAIRQYLRARKIARYNKGRQWSMTHGYFIIMGGFHLFERGYNETSNDDRCVSQENDIPLHPLKESDLLRYSESFTMPTEAEIKDKGKGDWLAKSFVLLQTSWFVMQCIARAVEHLPVTYLEIVTLAYVAMNFVIYVFWWNKPLNVNRPVRVFRKSDPRVRDSVVKRHGSGDSEPWETQLQVQEPISERRKLTRKLNGLETILTFISGNQDKDVDLSREDRVPRFWADNDSDDVAIANLIVLGVGVCFGAIHCIAWAFSSPTYAELLIWRLSSVAMTSVPIYIPLMGFLSVWLGDIVSEIGRIIGISVLPAGILYIIARAATLVLAFTSLRDLPHGAYETVHWTTFIPHV